MTDVLIENVPEDDLKRIDEIAARQGISRSELLKRTIAREAAQAAEREPLTLEHFRRLAELTSDLLDEDFVRRMWS